MNGPLAERPPGEWIVEDGIGETRAALIEGERIVEARILVHGTLTAGTVLEARLVTRLPERDQGVVAWDGGEALLAPLPRAVTEGATLLVEITRPALPEPGKPKRARARPAVRSAEPGPAPALAETLDGMVRTAPPQGPDLLEDAGWSELLEEAATGRVAFADGWLTISPTPAMTLIDVDGECEPERLAVSGAAAAARATRRLDIGGSIGIDLPTVDDRRVRLTAAAAIDEALAQPFERTAVNGFGFVQIVRRRSRLSLPEAYAEDAVAAHARALVRKAERSRGRGERVLTAHPHVVARIERAGWVAEIERRVGATLALRGDGGLAISAGHVQARFQ
ncbi:ribonuclease [Stakelama saccharophila]|uniref:Ribonuclease n=1 Tax=Stakelama saccharophila TaxID=3075605 RepID=A0ABZ0B8G7_9SPHN|nr:ribonuclease [Stakelama sp. W311]WNO53401.1 ribonuclease [Stakelama sp. W311]